MSQTATAAVVGTGFIGPVHVEALRRAGVTVRGILGSSPDRSSAEAARLGLACAYRDYAEVLADPAVSVVHLATPNKLHFEQAAAALRAGKHVMCEKPLAMNSTESAELVRLAAETRRAAGVNYNVRYYPLCKEARARIADGAVGEVFHVAGSYVQDWLLWDSDFNWRVLPEEGGDLRAMADIGTHWLDLVQHILARPVVAVCADLHTVHRIRQRPVGRATTFAGSQGETVPVAIPTDDYGAVLLEFAGGARGVMWVSQVTAGRKNMLRWEVAGSVRSMAWESEQPNQLWLGRRPGPNELLIRDPALLSEQARAFADYPGGHNEGFPDTFKMLYRDFYRALADGTFAHGSPADSSSADKPSYPTFADGHREIVLCEAVLRSHRERRWVSVPS